MRHCGVDVLRKVSARLRGMPRAHAWPRPARPPVEGGRVVVTGASGLIGGLLVEGLRDRFPVRGVDLAPGPATHVVADMRRLDDVTAVFAGADTVVDLAANSDSDASWDDVYANNVPATLNALEAARRAGVRRVVFASSNHVTGLYERDEPYATILAGRGRDGDPAALRRVTAADPIRPDGAYGIGKALGEAAARFYAEEHGLSVLCLRIGTVNQADAPTNERHRATLLSHRDLLQLVECCLAAPDALRFGVYYGVSANRWRIWDIDNARRELGFAPADDFETRR
jgi:dTDP-4-dehydrorhamnose reductase